MSIKIYSKGMQTDAEGSLSNLFMNDLETIYQTHSIYRGIVVVNINKEDEYRLLLENNTHSVLIIHNIEDIDYDALDSRVLIMDYLIFREFMNNILCYAKHSTSYNFIGITYDIDFELKDELIEHYNKHCKHNTDVIII
jgi:hypothetical protein